MSDFSPNKIAQLPADPARQADAMLRACQYQILQTVSAWLDLGAQELLVVEGAEDFDVIGADDAEAVQVKSSSQPISLAQSEVQEALNNFWILRNKTPRRRVRFRFLTRAAFTVEREKPFGDGVAGLELWRRSVLTDDEIRALASFLAKQERLLSAFRRWLETATPEEIRAELVGCIAWDVHAEDAVFVERSIHSKLAAFAELRGWLPASVSKRVARRLVDEVWKTLRKPPPRELDRFRLEEIWEEETRVSIPQSALDAGLRASSALPVPCQQPELLRRGAPPLPGSVVMRKSLAETIRGRLAATGLINLHGSTRSGKTTLAKLLIAPDADRWLWWSAPRRTPEEIERIFAALTQEAARSPEAASIVLDDLDLSPTAVRGLEDTLGELLATVRGRRGRVLITSQKPLPARLQLAFGLVAEQVVAVPRLDLGEITDLAAAFGCDDERRRGLWARLVHASTQGHPQLAAVRLFALRDRGWPQITEENLDYGVAAVDAEKADARQLLGELPEAQRVLLHRLSVFPQFFRRDHAVAMGATPPSLAMPGDLFDRLVGPWIEPLHAGYFALSPLIADCAREANALDEFRGLQNAAADVLLGTEPRTITEGANAFTLYFATRNEGGLVSLLVTRSKMDGNLFACLAEDLWWFTSIAPKEGSLLFSENLCLSIFLREFQFRIARVAAPERAAAIVGAWRWEIEHGPQGEELLARMMLASEVLPYYQVQLSAGVVVALLGDVAVALKAYPDMPVRQSPSEVSRDSGNMPSFDDFLATLAYFCTERCTNIEFLDEFITTLESTEPGLRDRILRGFIANGIGARTAIDRAWLAESDIETPDWTRCLRVLERTVSLARSWDFPELAIAGIRGIAIVLDEYLHDHRAAHAAIERLEKEGGFNSHELQDRRACVYFSESNYAAAEAQWRLALERWPKPLAPFDHGAAFATRSAGVAAARQGRWEAAAGWFLEIPKRLPSSDDTWLVAGAYADAGFAFWKAGRSQDSVGALIEAWRQADTLPVGKEDVRAFHTRKIVGHVIVWLLRTVAGIGVDDLFEPLPGMCTSAELPEKVRELPEDERAGVWSLLMRLERTFGGGQRAAQLGNLVTQATENPKVRAVVAYEALAQAVALGTVQNIPLLVIADAKAMHEAAKLTPGAPLSVLAIEPEVFQRNDSTLGCSVFLAALVVASTHGHSWQETVDSWRSSVATCVAASGWNNWFDNIETTLNASVEVAGITARDYKDWATAMLASLNLLLSTNAPPEEVFIAHARWLGELRASPWLSDTGIPFCQLVETAWQRAIATPALLRQPRINIPVITAACVHGESGIAKAVRILFAAMPAVSVQLDGKMIAHLRSLADAG